METVYQNFFRAMSQFRKIRFGDLFPDMTKVDGMTLLTIAHLNCGNEEGKITTSKLAESMQVQSSAISRTLKNLEEKGMIERTVNRADRRNTYVELTEHGKHVLEESKHTIDALTKAVFSKMEQRDLEQLIVYLDELYRITREEIENQRQKKRGSSQDDENI